MIRGKATLVLMVALLCLPSAYGQFSANIQGTVQDSSGGVIPNAHLTVTNLATQVAKTVMLIPMKVVGDSDLIPVTGSEVKPIIFGAKRRWHSYRA